MGNNCHRDAILIAFSNCATSIFAGFVIFSIVGFMAEQAGQPAESVIQGGTGLAFIAYPEAVTQMPLPPLWSFLFFTMLITLGLDSQFTMVETVTTAIMDQYPQTRVHKGKVVIGASIAGFLLGLTCCTRGGIFMFSLIDSYGFRRFLSNIEEMGIRIPSILKYYWIAMWTCITPIVLIFVLIMTFVQYSGAPSTAWGPDKYVFPGNIQAMGWLMALSPPAIIIAGAIFSYFNRKKSGRDVSLKSMLSPNDKWCSAEEDAIKRFSV